MSGEKIDLAHFEHELHACKGAYFETEDIAELLALVRAVRAAKVLNDTPASVNNWKALDAALAPFTDSAEVRSDGE